MAFAVSRNFLIAAPPSAAQNCRYVSKGPFTPTFS
jgi:hypothetical protein